MVESLPGLKICSVNEDLGQVGCVPLFLCISGCWEVYLSSHLFQGVVRIASKKKKKKGEKLKEM